MILLSLFMTIVLLIVLFPLVCILLSDRDAADMLIISVISLVIAGLLIGSALSVQKDDVEIY